MSVSVAFASKVPVVETVEGEFVGDDNTITTTGMNTEATLNASSTPPATKYSAFSKALSSGTGTIDLTSLPNANGDAGAVTLTGLKLAVAKFKNPSTNANAITVAKGASNGHTGLGADFSITLQPGAEQTFKGNDNGADVGSSDKTFDLSGTGAQELEVLFVAG